MKPENGDTWQFAAVPFEAGNHLSNIQAKAHALLIGHREVHHEPYPGSEEVAKRTICGMPVSNKWLRRPRKSIDCRQRTPMQFRLCQNCNEIRLLELTARPSSSIGSPKANTRGPSFGNRSSVISTFPLACCVFI